MIPLHLKQSLWVLLRFEQQEIVGRVEGFFALAAQIKARFEQTRAQADKLTHPLLARAMRGHLVPQDPTDEPEEEMLERIKSESEVAVKRC